MDNGQLSVAVWRPAESWQAEDKAVQQLFALYALRLRNGVKGTVVSLVFAGLAVGVLPHMYTVGALFALNAVRQAVTGIRLRISLGRWLPAAKSLLNGAPGHRYPARIVARAGDRAVLAVGPMYLRLPSVNWGLRQVIARAGEVTVIGPDAEGYAVVFVDGMPMPLAAKVVEAPEPTEAEPIARVSVNGAEDEVPNWAAGRLLRAHLIILGVLAVALAGMTLEAQAYGGALMLGIIELIMVAVVGLLFLTVPSDQIRLRTLLAAGRWQAYPVTIQQSNSEARRPIGGLTLVLSDGQRLSIKLAAPELVANISATGMLWMVGRPDSRKGAAVGIPGYPILTAARFA
jgi:hypothetical protein